MAGWAAGRWGRLGLRGAVLRRVGERVVRRHPRPAARRLGQTRGNSRQTRSRGCSRRSTSTGEASCATHPHTHAPTHPRTHTLTHPHTRERTT
eukprot:4611211-Pleurochrysis_carterae.AAC.1